MKTRLITTALAIAALSAGAALAQDKHDDHPQGGAPHGGPGGAMHGPAGGAPHGMGGPGGASHTMGGMGAHPMVGAPRTSGPVGGTARSFGGQTHTHMTGSFAGRSTARSGGSHFSYQGQTHTRIHGARFHYPRGYSYRRWGIGQSLPRLFLGAAYIFGDYSDYGLGAPPAGDEWVRYGPDLLLVDIDSGQIVDVVYGVFY
jgi:Ni/Co efflux regulator RcnB